jgi:hypothetical protein
MPYSWLLIKDYAFQCFLGKHSLSFAFNCPFLGLNREFHYVLFSLRFPAEVAGADSKKGSTFEKKKTDFMGVCRTSRTFDWHPVFLFYL